MIKQLIDAVSQSSYKCAETSKLNFFHVYNTQIFRQMCDSNKSVQIWWKIILRHIFCVNYIWNKEEKYMILSSEAGSSWGMLQRRKYKSKYKVH